MNSLKPYTAFSRSEAEEGSILVLAHNIKEGKRLAWRSNSLFGLEYTDLGIRLIRRADAVIPLADQQKLAVNIPHVVPEPVSCERCGTWGAGLDKDGMCGFCGEHPGEELTTVLEEWSIDGCQPQQVQLL